MAVRDGIERSPAYVALADVVERHFGGEAAAPIRDSFALGNTKTIRTLLDSAGFIACEAETVDAVARFPSLQDWVDAEVRGWVGGDFGEENYAAFMREARNALARYETADGAAEFALPAIIGTGTRG